MQRHGLALVSGLVAACVLAGCGGGGTPATGGSVRYDLGTVRIEGASGLTRATIPSPAAASAVFAGYYGARITGLSENGFGRLVFASTRPGTAARDICAINVDGTQYQRLTTWPYVEDTPAYSADGTKVAFECDVSANYEIYSMNANGTGIVRLTNDPHDDGQPAWSPDGTRIAFVRQNVSDLDIWVMNADGSGAADLTSRPTSLETNPAWSPDGRKIAFASMRAGNWDVYVMDVDGTSQMALTSDTSIDDSPDWSPDGARIAFVSDRVGDIRRVWTMDADGGSQTQLTTGLEGDNNPAWSPDGRRVAFVRCSGSEHDVFTIDRDGSHETNVTREPDGLDLCPDWLPSMTLLRSLIGAAGSDGGANPPFGTARPAAVVAVGPRGLLGAITVEVLPADWGSVTMEGLSDTGAFLAGVRFEANRIDGVREDLGRGVRPLVWSTPSALGVRSVLVLLDALTGRVSSVLASSSSATAAAVRSPAVGSGGGSLVVEGPFDAVWGTDPQENLAPVGAARVVLDAETGQILEIQQ